MIPTIQRTPIDKITSPLLQTLSFDRNDMAFSVSNPPTRQAFSEGDTSQTYTFQQPSTTQQTSSAFHFRAVKVQDANEEIIDQSSVETDNHMVKEHHSIQSLNLVPEGMDFTVSIPATMQLLPEIVGNQDVSFQQPSTSQQLSSIIHYEAVKVQENNEEVLDQTSVIEADHDPIVKENRSPNVPNKRSDAVEVLKSNKKHASTEMKFRCFEINWDKVSDNLLAKLNRLQEYKSNHPEAPTPAELRITKSDTTDLVNNIVDQLRAIDTEVKASVMEAVSKQLLRKYPCLELVDDDGFKNVMSHVVIKHKMINRNAYLNRFRNSSEQVVLSTNRGRNMRAGTLKSYWKTAKKECEKDVLSKLRRDEPELLRDEFLETSQAFVRYQLSESKDLKQLLSNFSVFRRRGLMNYHFFQATGIFVDDLRKYFGMKRAKIINYSETGRKFVKLNNECSDLDVFRFLAHLLGENINDLILNMEIGTRLEEIHLESPGPLLVVVDMGQDTSMYYVYANQARLSEGTADVICAVQDLLCVHFVHNFKYLKAVSKFLEFVQQYFLKIIPTFAYRVGNQQRVVQKLIENLSKHDFK